MPRGEYLTAQKLFEDGIVGNSSHVVATVDRRPNPKSSGIGAKLQGFERPRCTG